MSTVTIARASRKGLKRGARCIHGRSETPFIVKLEGETCVRRVYQDWNNADTRAKHSRDWHVPRVLVIKDEIVTLTDLQVAALEALPDNSSWNNIISLASDSIA